MLYDWQMMAIKMVFVVHLISKWDKFTIVQRNFETIVIKIDKNINNIVAPVMKLVFFGWKFTKYQKDLKIIMHRFCLENLGKSWRL